MDSSMFETEEQLREVDGLRWKVDTDGSTIATCVPRRLEDDFLYFHGPGKLGVRYMAQTMAGGSARLRWWKARLEPRVIEVLEGDGEGLIIFEAQTAADIPKEFFKVVRNPSGRGGFGGRAVAPDSTQEASIDG